MWRQPEVDQKSIGSQSEVNPVSAVIATVECNGVKSCRITAASLPSPSESRNATTGSIPQMPESELLEAKLEAKQRKYCSKMFIGNQYCRKYAL